MTGAMMGFPNTSIAVVGLPFGGFIVDNRFGNAYGVDTNDGVLTGIRKWDIWPLGQERRARNIADLAIGNNLYLYSCILYRRQELVVSNGAANSSAVNGYSLADLSNTSTFGVTSASLGNSTQLRILAPGHLVSFLNKFGSDIVVSRSLVSGATTGGCEINCITWPAVNRKSNIAENFAVLGSKPDGSGREAWAFGYSLGAASMQLYKIGNTLGGVGITGSVGAAITPAQIDAQWTNITGVAGITVDQTDGNLILGFTTTDGGAAVKARMVKLNSATGAIMWSTAVSGTPGGITYDVNDMSKNVVKNGTLYYIGSAGNTLFTINTITGVATSQTLSNAGLDALHGHQMSEDVSGTVTVGGVTTVGGSIMWFGGWAEGSTHPNYLGTFCLTQGNHAGNQMGWRYWPNGAPSPAPAYDAPATSRKRAWSYTLDGHTFYVLDMASEGTFLYDATTNQWCQFITQGYAQWNFANGCMWGQRIVAGDLISTDVWEMQPGSSLFDNGATEIIHVVTGGVVTRNRVYHSVDAFSLACSGGQLDDVTGATVVLSFSDDQGKTWVDMPAQAVTEGPPFNVTVEWRSLGAYTAPGRIFRITDTGGFLRIDGADAGIGSFDDPAPTVDSG